MRSAKITLRLALAFVFLYASISSLLKPDDWIGFIPVWMAKIFDPHLMLLGHAISELILGLWLLSGWKGKFAAIVAALDLLSIIVVNLDALDIIFRDIGLLLAAVALVFLYRDQLHNK